MTGMSRRRVQFENLKNITSDPTVTKFARVQTIFYTYYIILLPFYCMDRPLNSRAVIA